MGWRLHLTNQTIHRLHILPGKTPLLAAWLGRSRVYFINPENGVQMGDQTLDEARAASWTDPAWQEFLAGLVAPNKAILPQISTRFGELYLSGDGRTQLYQQGGQLTLVAAGQESEFTTEAARFAAVGFDRILSFVAALDNSGCLHLFQQATAPGVFNIGLNPHAEFSYSIAIAQGGGSIFASDGQQVVLVDSAGQVRQRFHAHYPVSRMECSSNGRLLVTCDVETNVLRLYNGTNLKPTHQRHAEDLMASATQVQLIADPPPAQVAVSALALSNKGMLAFALAGVICASDMDELTALP